MHEGKWFRSSPLYSLQYNTVRMSLRETISLLCFLSLFLFRMEINYTSWSLIHDVGAVHAGYSTTYVPTAEHAVGGERYMRPLYGNSAPSSSKVKRIPQLNDSPWDGVKSILRFDSGNSESRCIDETAQFKLAAVGLKPKAHSPLGRVSCRTDIDFDQGLDSVLYELPRALVSGLVCT
jgi:hypothetical protein